MDFLLILFLNSAIITAKLTEKSKNKDCEPSETQTQQQDTFHSKMKTSSQELEDFEKLLEWCQPYVRVDNDLIVTQKMANFLWGQKLNRKALYRADFLWPQGIVPYDISKKIIHHEKVIKEAMQHWEENTCITFKKIDSKQYKGSYIEFTPSQGCWSILGKLCTLRNPIGLAEHCFEVGTLAHQIGHAIGFFHHHDRPDRDEHILFSWNLKSKMETITRPRLDTHSLPYDVKSIMHYKYNFQSDRHFTIITKDPWKQFDLGQKQLSFSDIKLAHILYNCSDHCSSKLKCRNEGFLDKNCKCLCPANFKGNKCKEKIKIPKPECYADIKKAISFTSPNYPNRYPNDSRCIYKITAPKHKRIKLTFHTFTFSMNTTRNLDRIEMRLTKDPYEGIQFSDNQLRYKSVVSEGNVIWIFLMTYTSAHQGFNATIKFIK